MNIKHQLALIREYAVCAQSALADEHEATVRYYAEELARMSTELEHFVKGM